jgi:hypothetical protein
MRTLETYFAAGRETDDGRVELLSGSLTNARTMAEEKCFFQNRREGTRRWNVYRIMSASPVELTRPRLHVD